jgi:two-component system response regulator PhoP
VRLLLVEDDAALRKQVAEFLGAQGYAVDAAADGKEGLFMGREHSYDLAVIDLGLPGLGGMQLIRELRKQRKIFPVLILTARANWQDKVEGLESGADDYLVKPFHNEELRARLNALLRRAAGHAVPQLEFGGIVIDTVARRVTRDGVLLELTGYEYNMLEYLVHRAGRIVSKTELTEHLYDQDFDRNSNVIEVFVGRLRKKLDPEGVLNPIATVRGQGYRFALEPDGQSSS